MTVFTIRKPRAEVRVILSIVLLSVGLTDAFAAGEDELNNTLRFSSVFFSNEPQIGDDRPQISKLSIENEVFLDLSDQLSLTVRPYLQYEHLSSDNRHMDLREFLFLYNADTWEFRAGIGQEFWGVVESRHLVDTINQSDFSADFTGDTKLGQPLVQLTRFSDYGDFSVYYLPFFREPARASQDSRPRLPFAIDESLITYESAREDRNSDFAIRWSNAINAWDIGLHYFNGTQRDPLLEPSDSGITSRYRLIEQLGIDAQATVGSLLTKLEWIYQNGDEVDAHSELVTGFEYTFSQLLDSQIDLGLLSEVLYDSRGEDADHLFQNDLMAGVRLAFNDANSTQALLTITSDLDNSGQVFGFDFNRRIGPNFTVGLEGQWWKNTENDAVLSSFSTEDNALFRINWFF